MHKLTPILTTLALLLGCGTPVGSLERGAVGVNEDQPSLYVSEGAIFFDSVCEGRTATHGLQLANIGGSPLIVHGLRLAGPGFSLRNRPALPLHLSPGERANVVVAFTPADSRTTPYEGNLVVTSTDPLQPVVVVPLFGVSLPGTLRVAPRRHDFGNVGSGNIRGFNLTLRAADECPVIIGGARATGQLANTIDWDAVPGRLDPGQVELINVRVRCDGQDDYVEAFLRFSDDAGRGIGNAQLLAYCEP